MRNDVQALRQGIDALRSFSECVSDAKLCYNVEQLGADEPAEQISEPLVAVHLVYARRLHSMNITSVTRGSKLPALAHLDPPFMPKQRGSKGQNARIALALPSPDPRRTLQTHHDVKFRLAHGSRGEVLEAVLAEVLQLERVRLEQCHRRGRQHHLPAVRGTHDPRGSVNVHADVLGRVESGLAGVDTDAGCGSVPPLSPTIASLTADTAACAEANA